MDGHGQKVRASVADAARNNAEWCELMCRAHGGGGLVGPGFWASPRRTPPLYPDAVTLRPDADQAAVLAAVDLTGGCSIKDSFACLDLRAAGFAPIIDATWIARPADLPVPSPPVPWSVVDTASGLAEWAAAWGADGPFRPELLDFPEVRVLAARRAGEVVAGAVVNHTGPIAGVTNLFAVDGDLDAAWAGVLAVLAGRWVVGYETGRALTAATTMGFTRLGPLRVWLR